jgi:hypothetical protein
MPRSNIRSIRLTPSAREVSSGITVKNIDGNIINRTDNVQYLEMVLADVTVDGELVSFVFPFPPQQVSYSELAPEFSEIRRPGRVPLIAFSGYKLKKVQIEFLVAVPSDGMFIDIEDDLDFLRNIVDQGGMVLFLNADKFLGYEFGQVLEESRAPLWTITDMSFDSVRRNANGKITSAQVRLSLTENYFRTVSIVQLPEIIYEETVPERNGTNTAEQSKEDDFIKWTEAWDNLGRPLIGD